MTVENTEVENVEVSPVEAMNLPEPRTLKIELQYLVVDKVLNVRDAESYNVENMRDTLKGSGSLKNLITVFDNEDGTFTVGQGNRTVTALQAMRADTDDVAAWDLQWNPIFCLVYAGLTDRQKRFLVNDHSAQEGLNKIGCWNTWFSDRMDGISSADTINVNWTQVARAFKNPSALIKAIKRIKECDTEGERKKARVDTVKQHSDCFGHVFKTVGLGVTNLKDDYERFLRGQDTKVACNNKSILSALAARAQEDVDAGRKPMSKASNYYQYWQKLLVEKAEADKKKKEDVKEDTIKPATKDELDNLSRMIKSPLGRELMNFVKGDKTALNRIVEMEKNIVSLADCTAAIADNWTPLVKLKAKAAKVQMDGILRELVDAQHKAEEEAEELTPEEEQELIDKGLLKKAEVPDKM